MSSNLDLDALEREAMLDEFGPHNGLVLALIQRLRTAEVGWERVMKEADFLLDANSDLETRLALTAVEEK